MKKRELYSKVQLLKAGQVVQINGDFFRAVQVNCDERPILCTECDLDSICHDDVLDVCCAMEAPRSYGWMLKLAHPA